MLSFSQKLMQTQKLSPQQIQYQKLLQLNTLALEQRIKAEIEMNPLLDEQLLDEVEISEEQTENDPVETGDDEIESISDDYEVEDFMNDVVLETESPVPALLLLSDMMAPGWDVEIDGQDADLLRADLVLRAVALPAGNHVVRFHYRDPSVRAGLGLSLSGALVVLFLLLPAAIFPRRRSGGKTTTGDGIADD
jgi:hypothetical protein